MSFSNLKKNKANALAGLQQKIQESASESGSKDPRKWRLTMDKASKVGSATIRFLPYGDGERLPWAEWQEFSFKGKGGNYWNRSLRTIGKDDPVAELNHLQWERKQGGEKGPDETAVRNRSRRLRYISNIVVVNDPANPSNNGKVFLFEYGPAIHKKIMKLVAPEYEDQKPVPVHDMWEGCTFRIRSKNKSGYVNYDDSEFDSPSVLHNDDSILEQFYNGMHQLEEFEGENHYKTYEELEKEMKKVLGETYVAGIRGEQVDVTAGGSPFQQQTTQGQQPQQGSDPFAQQNNQQQSAGNSDPFAGQTQQATDNSDPFAGEQNGESQPQQGSDPFAQQNNQQQSAGNSDPFAGSTAGGVDDDPFADLNLG